MGRPAVPLIGALHRRMRRAKWSDVRHVQGPGLQHLALKSDDIVATLRKMRRVSDCGGFDFMPPLDPSYYRCWGTKHDHPLTHPPASAHAPACPLSR